MARKAHSACLRSLSDHLPGAEHSMRCVMKRFESRHSDAAEFAELDTCPEIAGDHVGLHHQAHILLQRECGHLSGGTAPGADDWGKISATKTMHEIVVGSEAVLFNDPRC